MIVGHFSCNKMNRKYRSGRGIGFGRMIDRLATAGNIAYGLKRKYDEYGATSRSVKRAKYTGGGVTQQHDTRLQYKKSRMPRKKRIRWKKFVQKVKAVADSDRGVSTFTYNGEITPNTVNKITVSGTLVGQQVVGAVHMYGNNGTVKFTGNEQEIGNGDIGFIQSQDILLNGTSTEKVQFHSAVCDLTIHNTSLGIMEVDIYDIVYHKSAPVYNQLIGQMNTAQGEAKDLRTGGSIYPWLNNFSRYRGVTPFEQSVALSQCRVKILTKRKYFIGAGQSITKQYRDPKNRQLNMDYSRVKAGLVLPGWTRTLLVIGKNAFTPVNDSELIGLRIGATRTYKYTIEGQAEDRTLYIANA